MMGGNSGVGGGFNPALLFAAGEQGAWYDPSDFERYMAGGPNLFPDPDWATLGGWEVASNATIAVSGGELIVTATGISPSAGYRLTTVIGKQYEVQIALAADAMTGNTFIGVGSGGDNGWSANLAVENIGSTLGRYSIVFTATTTDTRITIFGSNFAIAGETFRVTRPVVRELTAINTATMFQDSAGTIPVTASGQLVGKMLDKSGNGLHVTSASDAVRPTLQTVNGRYALVGTGTHYLACSGGGNYPVFTLVGAVSKSVETGINGWFSDRQSSPGGFGTYTSNASVFGQIHNGSSYADINSTALTLQANVPYVQVVGYNGTAAYTGKNGGQEQSQTLTFTPDVNAQFNIMGGAAVGYWNGAFFGCVYINRTLTDSEKGRLNQYYFSNANIRPLIAVGDSHTFNNSYGQTAADFYPDRLDVLLGADTYQVQNLGVSGNTTANMVARITAGDHARNIPNGVAVIYGGTNDTNETFSVQASPSPTSTVFAVEAGRGSRFGAGAYITVNGVQAIVQSVATDTITLTSPLGSTPTAGQVVLIDTTANLVKVAQTINSPRTIICGQHYLNFASGGDTVATPLAAQVALRALQSAAAATLGAVYVDFHAYMRDLIVAGTYTQDDDTAWHVAVDNTHLNNTGEQILADAIFAAMQAQGWA